MPGQTKKTRPEKSRRNLLREQLKSDLLRRVEAQTGEAGVMEYRFAAPERRWRSDLAWPNVRVALEIDGGTWNYGRHNRASSMPKEMEKNNGYAERGWLALHALWKWVEDGTILQPLIQTIRRQQEGRGDESMKLTLDESIEGLKLQLKTERLDYKRVALRRQIAVLEEQREAELKAIEEDQGRLFA